MFLVLELYGPVVVNDTTGLICILHRLDDQNTARVRR